MSWRRRELRPDEAAIGIKRKDWSAPEHWGAPAYREVPMYRNDLGIWVQYSDYRKWGAVIQEVDPPEPFVPRPLTAINHDLDAVRLCRVATTDERND